MKYDFIRITNENTLVVFLTLLRCDRIKIYNDFMSNADFFLVRQCVILLKAEKIVISNESSSYQV
jgi:hypothetical protein